MNLPTPPSFRLDGKCALVSGGARGIGLGGAVALAQAGADVMMVARSADEIEQAAASLRAEGWQATGAVLDVCDVEATRGFVAEHGPFDVLYSNAGTNKPTPYLDVEAETYDHIVNVNMRAAFFLAQAVARGLVQAGRPGSIIHTSSQMGHVGGIERSVYCGSKFAIEGITKASAIELAPHKIRVNTIAPTFIRTPMTQATFDNPERVAWITDKIKLGRVGEIEDIMGALIYLASDASALVTGTSIIVDGGWTAD